MATELSPELEFAKLAVLGKLDEVEAALTNNDPLLKLHCSSIHKALLEHEELVHILPDDKIRLLMAGMKKYQNIQLVAEASKTRAKAKVTADDL
jgi:hypothetical protein